MRAVQVLTVVVLGGLGCGGAPRLPAAPPPSTPEADAGAEPEPGEEVPSALPVTGPAAEVEPREPPPTYVLWCYEPTGAACRAAEAELGVTAVEASRVPKYLLQGFVDEPDDCAQPGISDLLRRLEGPLHLDPGRYVDQVGDSMTTEEVDAIYSGGGCLNSAGMQGEIVKVHAQHMVEGDRFLVRIWDGSLP